MKKEKQKQNKKILPNCITYFMANHLAIHVYTYVSKSIRGRLGENSD